MLRKSLLIALLLTILAAPAHADPYPAKTKPRETARLEATWKDTARSRDVPVLIVYPKDLGAPAKNTEKAPLIIFSHGLGGMPAAYEDYGKLWASYGYVVILPQHHGTDAAILRNAPMTLPQELQAFIDRFADIHFVLDQADALQSGKLEGQQYAPFKNHLDLTKIGMAGHSAGAVTTQALVGQTYDFPLKATSFADKRIAAAIAMSPYPPMIKGQDPAAAFASIKVPVFYLTGTNDTVAAKPEDRRIPFDHSKTPGTLFLNFTNADHLTFLPWHARPWPPQKEKFQQIIRQSTTAFWDAHLKSDEKAKQWLAKDLKTQLGTLGKLEEK